MNEVYIDGCNVAECKFFIEEYIEDFPDDNGVRIERFCAIEQKQCHDKINCYFKQLQRAKAEFKQYKKSKQASYEAMQREWNAAINEYKKIILENEHILKIIDCKNGTIAILKAENEKLKAIADKALNDKNNLLDNYSNLLEEKQKLGEIIEDISKEIVYKIAYKQALEDIKSKINEVLND